MAGLGIEFHFRELLKHLWPWLKIHKWADLQIDAYLKYRIIGQLGPASSGKSFVPAACVLADYYVYPSCTTVLVSSTTRESLEMRVLGELKKLHKSAKGLYSWLPGYLIEGKQRIVTDPRSESSDGRDFRNGLVGVACRKGQAYQGIEEYVGIKNKRVRLLADELQFMPRQFVDSIANMNKNPDFKCVGSGNPKDTTDALGVLCEPSAELGGWDGGIDQVPGTKTWPIRFSNGICIQLCGPDSPNLDGKLGIALITQEQINEDIKFYGEDSVQFSMMDMGRMPRGQGSRRVLTRQMCLKFQAMEEPIWLDANRTKIAFLDAAFRGVGGDRCVFGEMQFGLEAGPLNPMASSTNLSSQESPAPQGRKILALIDTMVVPIKDGINELPEDQIVTFVKLQCEQRGIPPENFFFDSGMKSSLVSAFARLWTPAVVPVDCGGFPSERRVSNEIDISCKDYYSKYITELWFSMRLAVEARQFRGMTEEVMMEFCYREWQKVSGNKIEVEPKDKMKVKSGRSPDLADAVALGLEGARQRGFVIMRLTNDRTRVANDSWKRHLREQASRAWRSGELNYAA